MKFVKKVSRAVQQVDFFNSSQLLRYEKENDYRTFTGGFISLGVISVILIGFAKMIFQTISKENINTKSSSLHSLEPPPVNFQTGPEHKFMISIMNPFLKLDDNKKYVDVNVMYQSFDKYDFIVES